MGIFDRIKKSASDKPKPVVDEKESKDQKADAALVKPLQAAATAYRHDRVLVQPRISEKSGHLVSLNKYVFAVKKSTNKVEVKKAIEKLYKVRVVKVNIVNMKGKSRKFGRIAGRTSDFKKAVVTLKPGDKIEGFLETT